MYITMYSQLNNDRIFLKFDREDGVQVINIIQLRSQNESEDLLKCLSIVLRLSLFLIR